MGILVPETCWGNETAYFVASSCFFAFHYVYDARSHEHQIDYTICFSNKISLLKLLFLVAMSAVWIHVLCLLTS
jgi:hypothetical protein